MEGLRQRSKDFGNVRIKFGKSSENNQKSSGKSLNFFCKSSENLWKVFKKIFGDFQKFWKIFGNFGKSSEIIGNLHKLAIFCCSLINRNTNKILKELTKNTTCTYKSDSCFAIMVLRHFQLFFNICIFLVLRYPPTLQSILS